MGADMIIHMIPASDLTDERIASLHEAVKTLPDESLDYIRECIMFDESYEEVRTALHGSVDELAQMPGGRDVTCWQGEPLLYPVWISGGLSWGDLPTEACNIMATIGAVSEIWALLREWAEEDSTPKMAELEEIVTPAQA